MSRCEAINAGVVHTARWPSPLQHALGYHGTAAASGGRPGHEPPRRASPPKPDPTPAANQREEGPVAYDEHM